MRALLLAAGLGTRLRPITNTIPKCLVPIHGKALLDYWFDLLFEGGIERVLVNTHYFADTVAAHVASSPWRERIDIVYEPYLLGTGGTVLANRDYFDDGPMIVAHADNLTDLSVSAVLAAHARRPRCVVMTMLAFRTDDPPSCGILELEPDERVKAFHEKVASPPGNLANGAVYVFEKEVTHYIASLGRPVVDLSTEVMPHFLGRILAVEHQGYHRDIGNPEALRRATEEFPRMGAPAAS